MKLRLSFIAGSALLAAGSFVLPAVARAETLTLSPIADTYLYAATPSASYGSTENIAVRFRSIDDYAKSLLRFSVSAIPASSTIQSATLALVPSAITFNQTTYLYGDRVTADWDEATASWSTAPALGERIATTPINSWSDHALDITSAVQNWVSGTWANQGVQLSGIESTAGAYAFLYWSREATNVDYRPVLTIEYTPISPPVPATTTLAITTVSHAAVASAATVSFTTSLSAVATVEYGPTASYGSSITETDPASALHAITITGLSPATTYHYRIVATAGGAAVTGEDRTFTTPAAGVIAPGTLVKTADSPAVYYVGSDGKRHAFPNDRIYKSWYADFSAVQTISATAMAGLPLGANVTYRPGVRMVKFATLPKAYAVGPKGELRWVSTESIATSLYGAAWNTLVDDLSDAFFVNYSYGADIVSASDFSPAAQTAAVTTIDQNL